MTVGELTAQMVVEAKRLGFSEATIWRGWMPGAGMVAKYYREQGLCVYDPAVTDKFLQKLEDRYASGEVSYNYLRQIRQITRRLNEFYLTGTLRIDATQHGTKYVLSSHSERLVDLFAAHQEYGASPYRPADERYRSTPQALHSGFPRRRIRGILANLILHGTKKCP